MESNVEREAVNLQNFLMDIAGGLLIVLAAATLVIGISRYRRTKRMIQEATREGSPSLTD